MSNPALSSQSIAAIVKAINRFDGIDGLRSYIQRQREFCAGIDILEPDLPAWIAQKLSCTVEEARAIILRVEPRPIRYQRKHV